MKQMREVILEGESRTLNIASNIILRHKRIASKVDFICLSAIFSQA